MSLIFRIFFRLLYHEFAWAYDLISAIVSGGRWNAWVAAAIPLISGPDVLEIGFGPGHLYSSLVNNALKVVGLDASRQMAQHARKKLLRDHQFSPLLVRGQGQALPFPCQAFDTVVATFPTAFIFQPAAHHEVRRVLRHGGSLVILLSAWITERTLWSRFLAWLFRVTGQSLSERVDDEKLLRPFQESGLDARLRWADSAGSRLLFVIATRR